jgi:hypothetical protein
VSVVALMQRLREAGVQLWLEEGKLKFRAPSGAMTAALRAAGPPEIEPALERRRGRARGRC